MPMYIRKRNTNTHTHTRRHRYMFMSMLKENVSQDMCGYISICAISISRCMEFGVYCYDSISCRPWHLSWIRPRARTAEARFSVQGVGLRARGRREAFLLCSEFSVRSGGWASSRLFGHHYRFGSVMFKPYVLDLKPKYHFSCSQPQALKPETV